MTSRGWEQTQFLTVLSREEAASRFAAAVNLRPVGEESIPLDQALGRVLSENIVAGIDVPGFDRSNMDGFALQSSDTLHASEESPRRLRLNDEILSPGNCPEMAVAPGHATAIATGGMLPRGADAVVAIEYTDVETDGDHRNLVVRRMVAAGEAVTFAGTDISRGETVLRVGQLLTSRELGVLAALGMTACCVYRKPRIAVFSTGDEIVPPGNPLPAGSIYDANSAVLAGAIAECGGESVFLGGVRDDENELERVLKQALTYDGVILSGGTSKGGGDISYQVVSRVTRPGILAHGVALKPGKPVCLAAHEGKPVVILPGFPTSAIFTFHEFFAPVLRVLAGQPELEHETVEARLPMRVNSERGRTEYVLVNLIRRSSGLWGYPLGKGSGSVTTFSQADGFFSIDERTEYLDSGAQIEVTMLGKGLRPVDLVIVGSHCIGLDALLTELSRRGIRVKSMFVGSQGGLTAAQREECDLAGVHLFDPVSGEYNRPFVGNELRLITGYRRMQCFVFRRGDVRFENRTLEEAVAAAQSESVTMVNRNSGSGTRVLIDELLAPFGNRKPAAGYGVQCRSHNAVAAAVAQGRADWGVAIDCVARMYGLSVIPIQEECYDFIVPRSRWNEPAVASFRELLQEEPMRQQLRDLGFRL